MFASHDHYPRCALTCKKILFALEIINFEFFFTGLVFTFNGTHNTDSRANLSNGQNVILWHNDMDHFQYERVVFLKLEGNTHFRVICVFDIFLLRFDMLHNWRIAQTCS
jgi:hypothetical protein